MPVLTLDFQEGFTGQAAVVTLDGQALTTLPSVTTRLQIGRAARVEQEVPSGRHALTVQLEDAATSSSLALDITGPTFVSANLANAQLTLHAQSRPFRYA
ncbi:MAG: hypothetical protein ABW321_31710 [Polyangiales bacterium]